MNGKKNYLALLFVMILIAAGFSTVYARGNSEAGQPEPVEVKTAETAGKVSTSSDYPPQGWVTDIREAYRIAQADNKKILVNFTGSDWCVWCKKLRDEIFTTPEFTAYADKNLVLLFLDFPNGIDLSAEQVRHNQIIAQLLNVRGYPSIWLLDSDLSALMVTGYREGGASEYIRHLTEDRPDVSDEDRENFRKAFAEAIEANIGPLKQEISG